MGAVTSDLMMLLLDKLFDVSSRLRIHGKLESVQWHVRWESVTSQ